MLGENTFSPTTHEPMAHLRSALSDALFAGVLGGLSGQVVQNATTDSFRLYAKNSEIFALAGGPEGGWLGHRCPNL